MAVSQNCADEKVFAEQLFKDNEFAEEFVCKICQVHIVGCGPKLTKCSHLFCGDCLEQWFEAHPCNQTWAQRAKAGGSVPCPVCKTALQKRSDIYPVAEDGDENSAFLWQIIQSLKVRCDGRHSKNASGCCGWIGEYGQYWEHLESGTCGHEVHVVQETPRPEVVSLGGDKCSLEPCHKLSYESDATQSQCSDQSPLDEFSADDSNDDSGAEASSADDSNDDSGAEADSQSDTMTSQPWSPACDPIGKDLASSIRAYVDLAATECSTASPDESALELHDSTTATELDDSIPAMTATQDTVIDSDKQQNTVATKSVADKHKKQAKSKKTKAALASDPKADEYQSWVRATSQWQAYQVQAYQYQAARYQHYQQAAQYQRYQIACAYQYQQMASHAARVQQAVQRQR